MTKKVHFGPKPTSPAAAPATADKWVESRTAADADAEPIKRLTLDLPESLHRKIKTDCAMRGTKMAEELRELLIQKYGNA